MEGYFYDTECCTTHAWEASLSQGGRLFSPITDSLPCLRCAFYELKVRFIVHVHSYVDIFGVKAIEPSGILDVLYIGKHIGRLAGLFNCSEHLLYIERYFLATGTLHMYATWVLKFTHSIDQVPHKFIFIILGDPLVEADLNSLSWVPAVFR